MTAKTATAPEKRGWRARLSRFLQEPGTADLAPYQRLLPQIAAHEPQLSRLSDDELRRRAANTANNTANKSNTDSDAEFCAIAREAALRGLGQRAHDVQLLGVLALLNGCVAEMATGEGKTLAGALAASGYALRGRSVQIFTVNDYLAERDAQWMRPVYDRLGVSVASITQADTPQQRRAAYAAQVTYAPVSEIGFDVLRDRLCTDADDLVAAAPDVVLIDEADSVLIDEAMVPLVLAGSTADAALGQDVTAIARELREGHDFEVDQEGRAVQLTEAGARAAERTLGGIDLYTTEHADTLSRLNVALHARALLHRDVDYLVTDGRIQLINESRGRVAKAQRWPDGLHAAVEAKEGLTASQSGEILDSLTVQGLVKRYPTVCGMTGTAVAVGAELREFYQLEVVVIPTDRPCIRLREPDRIHHTIEEKDDAIVAEVAASHAAGRPVLIGTLDVGESERLAAALERHGVPCRVLNAKNDAAEAAIVAEAGARGAVTVSTQMAGRGTDIRLGGSAGSAAQEKVVAAGGLQVIGTGRHASSRLDQQLRGRCARQGDPGSSVVFTSMDDALLVKYGPGATGESIEALDEAGALAAMDRAQRLAEVARLETHRNTWRYHQLLDDQRRLVLEYRDQVLHTDQAWRDLSVHRLSVGGEGARAEGTGAQGGADDDVRVLILAARQVTLWQLDRCWADHLAEAADLREGIHLRALGRGLNPLTEFNRALITLFEPLFDRVAERSAAMFETVRITTDGAELGGAGFVRPTATWTYLVQDNPFGGDLDRAARSLGRAFRR